MGPLRVLGQLSLRTDQVRGEPRAVHWQHKMIGIAKTQHQDEERSAPPRIAPRNKYIRDGGLLDNNGLARYSWGRYEEIDPAPGSRDPGG